LARLFGGSDVQRRFKTLETMEAQFSTSKRDNVDSVESLKEDIRTLEAHALHKKQEFEKAHGDSKRVIAGEIERIFRELDRLRGRETILATNLDRIGVALAKIGEAKAALKAGVSEEQFDSIAVELQDLFADLRQADKAARDLEREAYEVAAPPQVETEQRMADLTEEPQAPITLSPETEQRLKKLEAEEA
jgi:hypothetical protein